MLLRSWPVLYRPHTVPHVSALQSRHGQRPAPWHAGTWQANARITRNHVRDPVGNRRTLPLPLILYDIVIWLQGLIIMDVTHLGALSRSAGSKAWSSIGNGLDLEPWGTGCKWVDRIGGWMRHNELVVYLIIQHPIVWDFNQQQSLDIWLKALGSCTALTFPYKPQLLMSIVKLAARVAVTTWHALGWSPAQKMLKALIYATCNSSSDMQWKSKMPNSLQPQSPITCGSPKVLITVESFEFVFAALAE